MSNITSQIVHLALDAFGDRLSGVRGHVSDGDQLDAMRAALEVADVARAKSSPEHQTDMLLSRAVLNHVVVPGAQPVEAVDMRTAFEKWAGAKGYALHIRDMKGSTRLGEYGYADTQRLWEAWQDALAHPRSTAEQAGEVVAWQYRSPAQVEFRRKPSLTDDAELVRLMREVGGHEVIDLVPAQPRAMSAQSFQERVSTWMDQCFLPSLYSNMTERGDRLLEEVLELLQATGYDRSRVATLVDYVYGRPTGEPSQEVGGVMVTLAGFCWIARLDMHADGERELTRITQPGVMAKIRAKQEAKNALHFDTPLPGSGPEVQS